jgi:hypothetical protein
MINPNSYTENDTMKQSKADIQSSIKINKASCYGLSHGPGVEALI